MNYFSPHIYLKIFRGSLEHLKESVPSLYKRDMFKLIKCILRIKLHEKHCQMKSNAKPS